MQFLEGNLLVKFGEWRLCWYWIVWLFKNHSILRWLLHKALSNRFSYDNLFRSNLVYTAYVEIYIIFFKVSWPSNDDVMKTSNQPWVNQLLLSDLLTSFYQDMNSQSLLYESLYVSWNLHFNLVRQKLFKTRNNWHYKSESSRKNKRERITYKVYCFSRKCIKEVYREVNSELFLFTVYINSFFILKLKFKRRWQREKHTGTNEPQKKYSGSKNTRIKVNNN